MGLTIEDVLVVSKERYAMELVGGANGWSNSISWILLIEDSMVLRDFTGRDLAVTTGVGFDTEEKLMGLVEKLVELHASGLIINTGPHIGEVPERVKEYCDENSFPLLTVPWDIHIYEMIKDLSIRVFLQGAADEQITQAFIRAIEDPGARSQYEKELLPYFDVDGTFQIVLISTGDLDVMDTVERRRISYRVQIYLKNISHNAHFFYYDSCFTMVVNALPKEQVRDIVAGFTRRMKAHMPMGRMAVGVGSVVTDVSDLQLAYRRARAAVDMALGTGADLLYFDEMGVYRLLGMVTDKRLLDEMGEGLLQPLLAHDRKHGTVYVETLRRYLESGGSVQSVAQEMFTHRNTVIYRVNNIKKILGCSLETEQERMQYLLACMILKM